MILSSLSIRSSEVLISFEYSFSSFSVLVAAFFVTSAKRFLFAVARNKSFASNRLESEQPTLRPLSDEKYKIFSSFTISRTVEVFFLFHRRTTAKIHFLSAIGTVNQSRKRTHFAHIGRSAFCLTNF